LLSHIDSFYAEEKIKQFGNGLKTAGGTTMSALTITPLHEDFGACITDIDLNDGLDAETVEDISATLDRHSLICFPGQRFDDDSQLAFTRLLGTPEPNHLILGETGKVVYHGTIGNVLPDGTSRGNSHQRTIAQTGNNMWHSDSSFRQVPSIASIMYVHEVPETGGDTEFVSARAAYERLPPERQAQIEDLVVVHDYVYSRNKVGPDTVKPSHAASLPPVRQKLVRRNPRTEAKNYYVGSHARKILGWNERDSRALIDDLLERATRPQDIYRHRWQQGELVIWDNRCLLHRGTGYDADKYRRLIRQTRVQGLGPTLSE
jgi:alpha-ketoglutarate-dependent 2,4-dichlorophenoxyacetate dioxygenase